MELGSIKMILCRNDNMKDYTLLSADVDKLSQLTDAATGSTALCVDTTDVYIKHNGEWYKL